MEGHQCRFLESCDNLRPLIKERFGREPSATIAQDIVACLQQGRLFYQAAEASPLEIRPLQLFYGMVGFAKALILARNLRTLSTLQHSHGIHDISAGNSRIEDLRVKTDASGTFSEFNDVVAELTRLCYYDTFSQVDVISLPSARASEVKGIELSLREILGRIPSLESLYQMTFLEEAKTATFGIGAAYQNVNAFELQIEDRNDFTDRTSLRRIVEGWRARFPFLSKWRLYSAQKSWNRTFIRFENIRNDDVDEFCESFAICANGSFQSTPQPGDNERRFELRAGLPSAAGYLQGGTHLVAPIGSTGLHISEFSLHYLGLFLLSSLIRYRPEVWAHSLSRSMFLNERADDQALSLIERFLEINRSVIPQMVVTVLNPREDFYSSFPATTE
jgi:YaaC-like protein